MDARFVEDGEFRHSSELPEVPQIGQFVRLHDKFYKVIAVTWNLTRPFPYQKAAIEVDISERIGNDRPPGLSRS
jgi:hypothetical protein